MKKILVIHFSQSGQLTEILRQFTAPLHAEVELIQFHPKENFPFPWNSASFFNAMPETVLEEPISLEHIAFKHTRYDLIVLGYQPWFLSPSLPTTSLLKQDEFRRLLNNTPVVTVIGSRNMWLNAQESVKQQIRDAGGKLVGNVPLIDRHNNLASAVSIVHWMMTGKKERKWGIFPTPGVSQQDIDDSKIFGELLDHCVATEDYSAYQTQVLKTQKIGIGTDILFIEGRAKKLFLIWAKLIQKKKNRKFWVGFFKYYLLIALFIIAPILLTLYALFVRPFTGRRIKRQKDYFLGVELKN